MDVLLEIYKADSSRAEKEQNEETKTADANKKKVDEDYRLWITTEAH
jgi:hypothetical protein